MIETRRRKVSIIFNVAKIAFNTSEGFIEELILLNNWILDKGISE